MCGTLDFFFLFKKTYSLLMQAIALFTLLVGIALILSTTLTRTSAVTPAPTPTPTPTPTPVPDPLVTASASNSTPIDFTSGEVKIKYDVTGINQPSTFQSSADTFVVPKTGNYRVSAQVLVSETGGSDTRAVTWVAVNGIKDYMLGFGTVLANSALQLNGDVVVALNAGDSLNFLIGQFFGTSNAVGYIGTITDGTRTFVMTAVSIQYIKP